MLARERERKEKNMAGVNRVTLIGNLGKDPEVRYAQSGLAICKLRVAVTERVKKGNDWIDETEWFTVTTFGKTAENAAQYLTKGRSVYVEGRLKSDKYKDKEGVERTSIEVITDRLQYLGDKGPGGGARSSAPARGRPDDAPPASDGFVDDDLPF